MTSTPPPVWPAAAQPSPPIPTPPPARGAHRSTTTTLVAVAFVGALVGFAASQALSHSQLTLPSGISALLPANQPPLQAARPPAAQPAPPANAQPAPPANAQPAPPANAQPAPPANAQPAPPANAQPAPAGRTQPRQVPPGPQAPVVPQPPRSTAPVDPAAQAAIQQAIKTIDDAQVKAVAARDVSGLSNAAATSDFAAQQKAVTQDLLDNGVKEIKLVNIEWGPVSVNGNTATATAIETWTTTYADGSTDQSRDRNEYTLVQQDGAWKVQSDEHPDALPGSLSDILRDIPGFSDKQLPPGFTIPFPNQRPAAPGVQA